ncbi:unnamed protein product [Lathyrus sativus]|nr:unnamed protein product [Lathyrus sativus]
MEALQRSAVSFRRQGSSGFVWDDRFLQEEINKINKNNQSNNQDQEKDEIKEMNRDEPPQLGSINTVQRSRSNGGGRGFRTGKVSPAIEPPSPRISACGFCGAFGKVGEKTKPPKHRSR